MIQPHSCSSGCKFIIGNMSMCKDLPFKIFLTDLYIVGPLPPVSKCTNASAGIAAKIDHDDCKFPQL